ncbi:hypothetical protein TMatcc_001135 [Talaromyces marneffei ATCC 18224]|uniref:DNA repair protein RAD51 homolog 3 n=1 Tax=Talaromyces marneffei (strain ATCC 18224 / CBS 334.59 / QM 7333) TaxID=441960 RepID=B6QPB3_TALMQ|nr:conserved hypothetical protein [Talaromyces marneffei ATCC 18224]
MTGYDFLTESATTPRISSISASQALRASSTQFPSTSAAASAARSLPTGLDGLDDALCVTTGLLSSGIPRGSITEIYGPPGVGKTAFSLNIAAKVLTAGDDEKVIWIDTGSPIPKPRLRDLLISNIKSSTTTTTTTTEVDITNKLNDCITRVIHIRAHSLPHLLSLFTHPPPNFPPKGTSLIVIDTVSAPFQSYFPNATELKSRLGLRQQHPQQDPGSGPGPLQAQAHQLQWLLNRKWNVTSDMINKITKFAATHNLAVIVLNQTHTKIKGQPRPTLYPALAGGSWETCVQTRIVLYRDHPPSHLDTGHGGGRGMKVRYAEVMKKGGKVVSIRVEGNVFPFVIETSGLRELRPTSNNTQGSDQQQQEQQRSSLLPSHPLSQSASTSAMTVRKRKVDEIADSEDEDEDEFLEGQDDDFRWDGDQDEESVPLDEKDKDSELNNNN